VLSALDEMSPRRNRNDQDDIPAAQFADDEDDRPKPGRSRGRDDDDDRPRSRRRDEDDDDRPRSRRSRDEDADDRPKSKGPASDFSFDDDEPKSRRRRDEDDDNRPRSRSSRDDDEDDRPRERKSRNRDTASDSRSRAKGPASDFDFDDDKPQSRRNRENVDDDRPRARKADEDDDRDRDEDDDDRPRYSSRNKKKGGSKLLLLLLLLGGGGLALILGVVLVLVLDPFGLMGGGAPSEMLAFAPADSNSITFIDLNEARSLEEFRDPLAGPASVSRIGVQSDEVASVMMASKTGGGMPGLFGGDPDVIVFRLNVNADQTRIISSAGGKEFTASGKKYYRTNNGGGLYFASSRVVVVTKTEAILTGLLQKDDSKIVISDDLRDAARRADGTVAMANVGQAAEADLLGLMSVAGSKSFGPIGPGAMPPRGPRAKSTVFSVKASGDRGTGRYESTYDSPDTARTVADGARRAMEQGRGNMTDIESWNVSQSGSKVTLELKVHRRGKSMFPFGGGKF
jgi:hypothetical protein